MDGRIAQPAVDRVRGPVHWPRCRFRNPVQRPLPFGALQERRSAASAGRSGAAVRSPALARRDGDCGRLPLFPADGLQGHCRTRQDRWRRHAGRLPVQHHGAAGAAEAAQSAGRGRAGRLRLPRAGRQVPRGLPRPDHRRHLAARGRRIATALFHEVRLQPDQPAQSQCRIDCDLSRPSQGSQHRRQRHQRADQFGSGCQEDRGEAREIAGSGERALAR